MLDGWMTCCLEVLFCGFFFLQFRHLQHNRIHLFNLNGFESFLSESFPAVRSPCWPGWEGTHLDSSRPRVWFPHVPGLFLVESCYWLKNWHFSGCFACRQALQGQRWDWLARCQYTMTGRDRKFDLQLLTPCGCTYSCLSRSVPDIHWHVAGMLTNQPTNNPWCYAEDNRKVMASMGHKHVSLGIQVAGVGEASARSIALSNSPCHVPKDLKCDSHTRYCSFITFKTGFLQNLQHHVHPHRHIRRQTWKGTHTYKQKCAFTCIQTHTLYSFTHKLPKAASTLPPSSLPPPSPSVTYCYGPFT